MKRSPYPSGFTLLEVLIVLAILLLGMTALSQLLNASARQSVDAEEKTSVQLCCQNRLQEILSGERPIVRSAEEPIPNCDDWTMTVFLDSTAIPELARVRIVAQKYERTQEASAERPGVYLLSRVPIAGGHLILAQWARRDSVRVEGGAQQTIGSLETTDPSAAFGFSQSRLGVYLPGESPAERGTFDRSPSENPMGGESVKIGGDPISESLLERTRARRESAE